MHVRVSAAVIAASLFACVDQIEEPEDLAAPTPILTASPSRSSSSKLIRHADAIAGRYIIVFDTPPPLSRMAPTSRAALDVKIDRVAARHGAAIDRRYASALQGFAAQMSASDALDLADEPEVLFVEEDAPVHASAVQTNPTYGLDRIDQPSLPLDGKYTFASDGAGTTVFVIDSGINTTHVEFTGRLRTDLGATAIDDGNGIEDCNGHGTHVSGTVGGATFGVAKATTIVPVRVLDCAGSGATSGVIAGMDFVAGSHPARSVVNMSLGGAAGDAKDTAVRNLVAQGVTVVVAAGNETQDACNTSPAREPMAITVASSTNADARSGFSNFGTCVDLFAPGSNIPSAWIDSDTATNTISGTSMASPHVAGAAAIYLAQHPSATPAQVTAALLGSAVANKISDVQGSPNRLLQTVFGSAPPPPPGTVKITSPADGSQVGSAFDVTVDATGATQVELAVDGKSLVVDRMAPFAFSVTNAPPGVHQVAVTSTDSTGKTATHAIAVTVASGGLGGGNHPVPPPTRRHDGGGCATAPASSTGLVAFALFGVLTRRRRVR